FFFCESLRLLSGSLPSFGDTLFIRNPSSSLSPNLSLNLAGRPQSISPAVQKTKAVSQLLSLSGSLSPSRSTQSLAQSRALRLSRRNLSLNLAGRGALHSSTQATSQPRIRGFMCVRYIFCLCPTCTAMTLLFLFQRDIYAIAN
ncbi:unnamed protein product, partial [Linum tenue]